MARRNKAKAQTEDETQRFSTFVQRVSYSLTYCLSQRQWANSEIQCSDHFGEPVFRRAPVCVSARCEVQVSSQQQKTLFDSPSCLRTSWRWSTWSAPSWWLSVNSWSCSRSAPTTCSGFSWWWNWEPLSQTMRWDGSLPETKDLLQPLF